MILHSRVSRSLFVARECSPGEVLAMSTKVSSAAKMTKTCASFYQVAEGSPTDLRIANISRILCMGVQRIDEKK